MRVLLITSAPGPCGIYNYGELASAAIRQADPSIEIVSQPEGLDPARADLYGYDWLWLNYHRGLHSRWTPEMITHLGYPLHTKILITFHDTYGEAEPDQLTKDLYQLADAFVVHERCKGLPGATLIRQGVLPRGGALHYGVGREGYCFKDWQDQPVLGTCGFNFPWKNFDALANLTRTAGWAYLVVSNNATIEDAERWRRINPATFVLPEYQPAETIIGHLAGCDATAFPYTCANSGTSGAIRLGIAARKPVIALGSCRQMDDLLADDVPSAIWWADDLHDVLECLRTLPIQRVDAKTVMLAEHESWTKKGQQYAALLQGNRSLLA